MRIRNLRTVSAGIGTVLLIAASAFPQRVYLESAGRVVIEAENTESLLGLWVKRTAPSGYTGTGALEFTGNNPSSGPATSPLQYRFKISQAGDYMLYLHIYKNLQGEAEDKCNDVFVRVAGDYTAAAGGANLTTLQSDNKLFGGSSSGFAWSGDQSLDQNSTYFKPLYSFKAGQTYTFTMSGRAQRATINRIVFATASAKATAQSTATAESAVEGTTPQPTSTTMKAIEFPNISAGDVPFYVDGQRLAIDAANTAYRDKWAAATSAFPGPTGTYDIVVSAMYESDGESRYSLKVGADSVGYFQCPSAWTGTSQTIADYTIYKHTFTSASVAQGATVKVYGMCNSNGRVPESGGFAWSRGRWTQVEFIPATTTASAGSYRTPHGTASLQVSRNAATFVATQSGEHILRVCSLDGKTVFAAPLTVTQLGTVTIPFNRNLVRGTYVTQIEGDDLSVCRRVVVSR